jgi:pilus assembly protein CpaF
MSAFGRKNGPGGFGQSARPQFGVARPMQGSAPTAPAPQRPTGGEQFPPLPGEPAASPPPLRSEAMARLDERMNTTVDNTHKAEGFEASVHKIKEEVLPACWSVWTRKRRRH